MNRFEELLASINVNPAMVVHVGAGTAKEYDLYMALNAERIIFVEPDQQFAGHINEKLKGLASVKVVDRAVATEKGKQLFNVISNRRFSSLLAPAALLEFYPNLTVVDTVEVETTTLDQLCLDENIADDTNNLLVAELQGLEKEIFSATEINTLNIFKWILIRSSDHQLYHPLFDDTQVDLSDVMQNAGFTVLCFNEDAPPYTNLLCVRNEAIAEIAMLKEREADFNKSIFLLEQKISEQERTNCKRIADFETSLSSKSDALQKKSEALEAKSKELESVSNELADALQHESEALEAKSKELESVSNELADARSQIQLIGDEKNNLIRDIKNQEKELAEMQQTLRINNKLLLKSETDLSDLQTQHRNALQRQEQQHLLLCELKEKLGQAAVLYRKLNLQKLVLHGDLVEQENSGDSDISDSDGNQD